MTLRNVWPLQVLWQENISGEMLYGVAAGINRVLSLAGVHKEFKIEYLAQRRQPEYLNPDGTLKPYQSLDWHIDLAEKNRKLAGHLNCLRLLDSLLGNPNYETEPRYELVVVKEPLHWSDTSVIVVNGIGRKGQGAVITLADYLDLLQPILREKEGDRKKRQADFLFGTQRRTIHEIGHFFGLFPGIDSLNPTDEERKWSHCLNECVMYWRDDANLHKKIQDNPFCPSCLEKLKQYFIEP